MLFFFHVLNTLKFVVLKSVLNNLKKKRKKND
jgi:hypothetical protein